MSTIEDEGFIIHIRKYGERGSLAKIFSENNGIVSGFLAHCTRKIDRYSNSLCNFVNFSYRTDDNSRKNAIETDIITGFLDAILNNKLHLGIFNSMISTLCGSSAENDNLGEVYKIFKDIIFSLRNCENTHNLLPQYVDFLLGIVKHLGININPRVCAVSGEASDIFYISPKTGNCVTRSVGEKYKNKLFVLPKCFLEYCSDRNEVINSINILHHFIQNILAENDVSFYKRKNIEFLKSNLIHVISGCS
jgi:DNA repair protein RecO (recombination protein O)